MKDEDIEKLLLQQKETLNKLENYIKENKENKENENKESENKENANKEENENKVNIEKENNKVSNEKENTEYLKLQQEYDKLRKEYGELSRKYNVAESDLEKYKSNVNTNFNKTALNKSKNSLEKFLEDELNSQKLTLYRTEEMYKTRINSLKQKISSEFIETNTKLLAELTALNNKIESEMNQHRKMLAQKEKEAKELSNKVYNEINTPKVPKEPVKEPAKEACTKNSEQVVQKNIEQTTVKNTQEALPKKVEQTVSKSVEKTVIQNNQETVSKNVEKTISQNNQKIATKNVEKTVPQNNKEAVSKNSFELKFGTKYTNILGFIFIIISILLLAQYSYVNFATSDLAKTILFYSSGVIVLVIAEVLNNRGKNAFSTFSIGLTAGGISILFVSTGIAYFYFNIISSLTGIILVLLTASAAFLLSLKYDRQLISVFAIIGAYLPIIVLFDNGAFAISALVYFLVCNTFSSLLAYKKRWNVLSYFSVILNFLSISVVFVFIDINKEIPFLFTMIYLTITLLFYVTLSLINPVKNNVELQMNEVVLLFMSIAIGTGLCYSQLYAYDMKMYEGVFTIALVIIFYCIGHKLKKVLDNRKLSDLMYITALFFAVLVAPMQLSTIYLSMVWMIMAVILLWYSSYTKAIEFMYAGTIFLALSSFIFFMLDISLFAILYYDKEFLYKYTIFTIGSIISLFIYMKNEIEMKKQNILFKDNLLVACLKVFNIFNVSIYVYYIYNSLLRNNLDDTLAVSILIVTMCGYIYYLLKTKFLTDTERTIYSNIILWITYLGTLFVNLAVDLDINSNNIIINIICVAIYNILILYIASQTMKRTEIFNKQQQPIVNIVLLIISILSITLNNDVQLGALNTLIFGVIAFVCILQGLKTFNATLRRLGLVLTIISIGKFFMFDLSAQNTLQKILSYFIFGVILISISYLYQKVLQKFEINNSDVDVNEEGSIGKVDNEKTISNVEVNSQNIVEKPSEVTTIDKSEDLPKE